MAPDVLYEQGKTQYRLVTVDSPPPLAFDRQRIVSFAVERVRSKANYSSMPCYLLPDTFTLADLQRVYERLLGDQFDKSSFRRKLADLDFLEPVKDAMRTGTHRPAQLYRMRSGKRPTLKTPPGAGRLSPPAPRAPAPLQSCGSAGRATTLPLPSGSQHRREAWPPKTCTTNCTG